MKIEPNIEIPEADKEIAKDIINKYEYFLANNKKQKEVIKKRILKANT